MSRSIHETQNEYRRTRRSRYTDEETREERLSAIREQLGKKQRIKSQVRAERVEKSPSHLPPAFPESIPIHIVEQGDSIHYPASSTDIQSVMRRLPVGVLTGLSGVRLCLGREYQEKYLTTEEKANDERDPWTGRVSFEYLPGVFAGDYLGTYWNPASRIDLYAYVYDTALPNRAMWELFLRLKMLSTFVHEVAHHDDYMRRVARGRWRADDTAKQEAFADATAASWVQQYVIPYIEETYPDEVQALNNWLWHHGGTVLPLAMLVSDWRQDAHQKKKKKAYISNAWEALGDLVHAVHEGGERIANWLKFARHLHYGGYYEEALCIIGRTLQEQPTNLKALTLKAHILEHKEEYGEAEILAQQIVNLEETYTDAWMVISDVYEAQQDWPQLLAAAEQGLVTADIADWKRGYLLAHCARAKLELGRYVEMAADLETMSKTLGSRLQVAPLRAVMLLRTGQYEEALQWAESQLAKKSPLSRAVFIAVRFVALRKLGRKSKSGELSVETLTRLRLLN